MVLFVLLHAPLDRFGLAVLHDGGIHHGNGGRVAATSAQTQGALYPYGLRDELLRGTNLHHTRWNVRLPDPRLVRRQRFLFAVLDLLRVYLNILGLWYWPIL